MNSSLAKQYTQENLRRLGKAQRNLQYANPRNLRTQFKVKARRSESNSKLLPEKTVIAAQKLRSGSSVKPADKTDSSLQGSRVLCSTPTISLKANSSLGIIGSPEQSIFMKKKIRRNRTPSVEFKSNILQSTSSFFKEKKLSRDSDNMVTPETALTRDDGVLKSIGKKLDIGDTFRQKNEPKKALSLYTEAFNEIIKHDIRFSALLLKIKDFYEDNSNIERNSFMLDNDKLRETLAAVTANCESEKMDAVSLKKQVRKLAEETTDLNKQFEERAAKYIELQDQFFKISQLNIQEIPQDEKSWKFFIAENKNFANLCYKLKKENRQYKYKEKKLIKLVLALKARGYPVEEIYEEDVQNKRKRKKDMKSEKGNSPKDSETDGEYLIEGPPKSVKKPEIVPSLNIEELAQDSDYYFESSAGSYSSESAEEESLYTTE